MSDEKDGGPAFPAGVYGSEMRRGMTLRDYFAGQQLIALAVVWFPSPEGSDATVNDAQIAKRAYQVADAMLAERAK